MVKGWGRSMESSSPSVRQKKKSTYKRNHFEIIKILFQCLTFPALCMMSVSKEKPSGILDSEFVQVGCGISGI